MCKGVKKHVLDKLQFCSLYFTWILPVMQACDNAAALKMPHRPECQRAFLPLQHHFQLPVRQWKGKKKRKKKFKITTFIFPYICTLRINWNLLHRTLHTDLLHTHLQNTNLLLLDFKSILEETKYSTNGACFISCYSGYFNVDTWWSVLHDSLREMRNFIKVSYIRFLKARHINSAPYCMHLQKFYWKISD